MQLRLAVLPGDGIGPEVTESALTALAALARRFDFEIDETRHSVGWLGIQSGEGALPTDTLQACLEADAVFLGAVGHPDADGFPVHERPEAGLLRLRSELGCWANLRPLQVPDALVQGSALREDRVRGTDLVVVRELGGGLYYGEPRGTDGARAWDTLVYSEPEVRRIATLAFDLARGRRGHVVSVDKANVLEASRLWRRVVDEVAGEHPDVTVEHMYVDRASMELVLNPVRFDVIVTSNLFGDILSDEAGALAGSLGVLGSASLGGTSDLYEPVHGSAPDLVGKGAANPAGALASVAMMLRHTFHLEDVAGALESALARTWADGIRTVDLTTNESEPVGTRAFTSAVLQRLDASTTRTGSLTR